MLRLNTLRFYACDDGGCSLTCQGGTGACSGCKNGCSTACEFCSTGCGDGCKGGCYNDCAINCNSSCSGTCSDGCRGCTGCGSSSDNNCTACTGSCTDNCNNGCSGENVTTIFNRITLNTVILASDIIDLRDIVANEATRRGKTPVSVSLTSNQRALATIINNIISNLELSGKTPTKITAASQINDNKIQDLITLAKSLYSINLNS